MASSIVECDICCNVFSDDNYPRILPCSHTFCSSCINRIIATHSKTCPACRKKFTATSAGDLTINRIALDVVKQLSIKNVKPETLSRGPTGSFFEWKKLTKEIHEQMKDVFDATMTLNEIKDELLDAKREIGRFKEMLTDIELSIQQILRNINDSGCQLEATTDFTLTEPFLDVQEKVKKIKDLLQKNQKERYDITNEIIKMRMRVANVAAEMQKAFAVETLVISAVMVIEGKQRVARVRVKPRNQVHLSHFAEGHVPPKSLVINPEALMNTSPRNAFLDLAIEGTFLARIVIKVMEEGNLALNFLHLCAGDLGPSYANSQLSGVGWKSQSSERIYVDEYIRPVMKVDWTREGRREIYKSTPYKEGEVRGWFSEENASNFYIVTKDHPSWNLNNCFGIVEEGLDTLRDATSQYPDITTVRIVDCGVIFSE
ncbi:tripartite motif-containing protein 59-like [Palaemon carinicauda]|uniref:tripartite motif-containing protein 59-like n=1 Tax=Palaemon carinicauda TaxID=392227 RepID=UPI0035B671A7